MGRESLALSANHHGRRCDPDGAVAIDSHLFRAVAPARRSGLPVCTSSGPADDSATASARQRAPQAWQPPVQEGDCIVMGMKIKRAAGMRWSAIGSALLLVAATLIADLFQCDPGRGAPDQRRRLPAGRTGPGRRRDRRADVAGRAAGPLGAAHRPQRHRAPHRRRRQHHGGRHHPRLHPRRGGPAGRRRRPGLRHQPATSTSTTRRRCPPRAATPRPPAPTGPPGRASTGCPASP